MRAAALATGLLLATPAAAETVRLLVSMGNDLGDPDDAPLRYAAEDARRVGALFVELGGVSADRAYLLENARLAAVRERLAEVKGRVGELAAAGKDVVLFLYVSGHAQAGVLHVAGEHLPLDELRHWLESTGARLRVIVVDACDSAAAARQKGGRLVADYDISLQRLPLTGEVLLASSGPAEPSQELESLGGALFTHYLLTGLRGDADTEPDGKVTLSEAYAYAYRRTLAHASRGGQHPAFDVDLVGTGELVLSEPGLARSAVVFPAALSGHFVVTSQPRPDLVAEVDKAAGKPLRLAMPAGRYVVRHLGGRWVGLQSLEMPYGGEATVDEAAMEKRDYREVTLKGGALELHPWAVYAGAALENEQLDGAGASGWLGVGVRRATGVWLQALRLEGTEQSFGGAGLTTHAQALSLSVELAYRLPLGPVTVYGGAGARLLGWREGYQRAQEAEIDRVFGVSPPAPRWTLGAGAGPVLGVEIPVTAGTFAFVEGLVEGRYQRVDGQPPWSGGVRGVAGLAMRF